MSFLAGAIVGNLKLDLSGLASGIAGAVSASKAGSGEMADTWMAAFEVIKRAAVAAFDFVVDTVREAGHHFAELGETAAKSGASVEFLSVFGPAAKDAGSSVEGLADAFKFLGKNATEAAEGNKEAVAAFEKIGISQAEVKGGLGDLDSLFGRVVEGMGGLGTSAERTRVAMELLGRGGTDLKAFLEGGSEGMEQWRADAERLGAVVSDSNAQAGESFKHLGSLVDLAWDGVKQQLATPILNFISEHFEEFKNVVIDVADLLRAVIPPALALVALGVEAVLYAAKPVLEIMREIAVVTDALGASSNVAPAIARAQDTSNKLAGDIGNFNFNVNATFDPDATSSQIAAKLQPGFRQVARDLDGRARAGVSGAKVAKGLGGRFSGFAGGGGGDF